MTHVIQIICVNISTYNNRPTGRSWTSVFLHYGDSDVERFEFKDGEHEQANEFFLRAQRAAITCEPFEVNEVDLVRCDSKHPFVGAADRANEVTNGN